MVPTAQVGLLVNALDLICTTRLAVWAFFIMDCISLGLNDVFWSTWAPSYEKVRCYMRMAKCFVNIWSGAKIQRKNECGDDTSSSPVVVFAHGAGAPSSSDWMIKWKDMLGKALDAVEVVTFDYPYIAGGKRKAPPKAEKLVEFHTDVVKRAVAKFPGHPLILAGKSMGSRVSCMVACKEDIAASAVLCLGYPLKHVLINPHFHYTVHSPSWVKGSKDGLCPLDKLEAVRKKMKSLSELHLIDGGDHSFKIGKKHLQTMGTTQDEMEGLAVQAIAAFISKSLGERKLCVAVLNQFPTEEIAHFFYSLHIEMLFYPVFIQTKLLLVLENVDGNKMIHFAESLRESVYEERMHLHLEVISSSLFSLRIWCAVA
ncbi:AB hydrolase-1 domain-containing protein [Citrus sinensis]|uniref:AB hydrolase-1 domain-containing protein n=1 Tax=Citrus sinensis TaxID=2711 RepID=A0ACB8LNW4_CITSI|nr:AB hydrolase-1 domain-containing protein [Citrus sinensis]